MTTAVQRRRGTATEHSSFTGLEGELSVNTTNESVHVHDGSTAGGFELARADASNIVATSIDINGGTIDGTTIGASSASTGAFTTLTATGLTVNGTGSIVALSDNAVFNVNVSGGTSKTSTINQRAKSSNGSNADTSIVVTGSSGEAVSSWDFKLDTANGALTKAMSIDGSGDISFYEDTGTTAKLFWDASAESLGIGVTSPASVLHAKGGSIATPASASDFLTNATARLVVNHANEYGAYFGYLNSTNDAIGIQSARSSGAVVPLSLNPYGGNVGIGTSAIMQDFGGGRTTLALKGTGTADYSTLQLGNYGTSSNGQIHGLINFYDGTTSVSRIQSVRASNTSDAHLAFYTAPSSGGITERLRIDSSGNVGIGTSSADSVLHLFGNTSSNVPRLKIEANGWSNDCRIERSSGSDGFYITNNYDTSASSADNSGAGTAGLQLARGFAAVHTGSSGAFTERMRIDSSGNLNFGFSTYASMGTVNTGCRLSGDGTTNAIARGSNGTVLSFYSGSGGAGYISVSGSSTAYNTSSDQRLKENIADADDAGSKIDAIQVRKFDWKVDGSHQDYGMIAQELETVAPEAVSGDADSEEMMGVDYSKLVPMLIKEIQSLRNRVAQLEE